MLQVEGLTSTIATEQGAVTPVDDVSLTLAQGETLALVGESGSGKSLTALSLLRLLPDGGFIRAGKVQLDGTDLLRLRERDMRAVRGAAVAMVFQEPGTSLNPVVSVGEQVAESLRLHRGLSRRAARLEARQWLVRVGLEPGSERRYPFQLSGGQKQRVMIAMALAPRPQLLIADEPTTALDVTIQAQILDLLTDLQREFGMSLLLITHDLGIVARMAQRVALMYAGQLVELAPTRAFLAQPRHPYARMLLDAVPGLHRRGATLHVLPGAPPGLAQVETGCRFAARCPYVMPVCRTALVPLFAARAAHEGKLDAALPTQGQDAVATQASPSHLVRCWLESGDEAAQAMACMRSEERNSHQAEPLRTVASAHDLVAAQSAVAEATTHKALALLDVVRLCVSYPLRRNAWGAVSQWQHAVRDLSFTLPRAHTLALVGESGSGKTTAGKAILRLFESHVRVTGEVWLREQSATATTNTPTPATKPDSRNTPVALEVLRARGAALKRLRRAVQIVFQDPYASLDPRLRVLDILREGVQALGQTDFDQTAATQLLEQVGLSAQALSRYPHEFSGGQRQRIAIARALAVRPQLLICDEPTSALDVSVQAQILNLLRQLQREHGIAMLFITHNMGVVEYLADTVLVLRQGEAVEYGSTEQVLTHPTHAYTQALIQAVPKLVENISV